MSCVCLCWMEKKTGREFKTMTFSRHEKLLCDQNYEIMNEFFSSSSSFPVLTLTTPAPVQSFFLTRISSLSSSHHHQLSVCFFLFLFVSASLTEPTDLPVLNIIVVSGSVHSRQDRSSEGFHETQRTTDGTAEMRNHLGARENDIAV